MKTIVHVVQHLRPGGIEVMVLDMLRFADKANKVFVVSLEGSKENSLRALPAKRPRKSAIFPQQTPWFEAKTVDDNEELTFHAQSRCCT